MYGTISFFEITSIKCFVINGNTRTGISESDTQMEPFSATAKLLSNIKISRSSKSCGFCNSANLMVLKEPVSGKLENLTLASVNVLSIY